MLQQNISNFWMGQAPETMSVMYSRLDCNVLYDLLFRTSAETLLEEARDPKHLGAEIGFFSVLHTWSQKLKIHPHVHCVVPAGGLSLDHTRWVRSRDNYFLPKEVRKEIHHGIEVVCIERGNKLVECLNRDGLLSRHSR